MKPTYRIAVKIESDSTSANPDLFDDERDFTEFEVVAAWDDDVGDSGAAELVSFKHGNELIYAPGMDIYAAQKRAKEIARTSEFYIVSELESWTRYAVSEGTKIQ